MKNLLVINASPRATRSKTRRLTAHFASMWQDLNPGGVVTERELGMRPPSFVDETWIAAAFSKASNLTVEQHRVLEESETLIEEVIRADVIVMGIPMYNYGFPASLKAWFDLIVRFGRTVELGTDPNAPYLPLLQSKPLYAIISASDGTLFPGGSTSHLNFLEPHLRALLGFIGLSLDPVFVRVVEEEPGPDREVALRAAEKAIEELLAGDD